MVDICKTIPIKFAVQNLLIIPLIIISELIIISWLWRTTS